MRIERSCGNVFADLGLANADELQRLARKFSAMPNGHVLFRDAARALREGVRD